MIMRVIDQIDYENYINRKPGNEIERIWLMLIDNLPSQVLKDEAQKTTYDLQLHPVIEEDKISKTFCIKPLNGSQGLNEAVDKLENIVSLLKD